MTVEKPRQSFLFKTEMYYDQEDEYKTIDDLIKAMDFLILGRKSKFPAFLICLKIVENLQK